MGFFDKLKASVGIGGAKIELSVPRIATSGSTLPVRAAVRGGKIAQQLNGVQLSVEIWPDACEKQEGQPAPGPAIGFQGMVAGSERQAIPPGGELVFDATVEVPPCQALYEASPESYAQLVLPVDGEDDAHAWDVEGPLPFLSGWESRTLYLLASADIPGAIDPVEKTQIHVIPEATGALSPAPGLDEQTLRARLAALGAARVFVSNASDVWFVWWSRGDGRVVGYSPIQIVCSVRAEGIARATQNPAIPPASVFPAQAGEPSYPVDGHFDEAKALATQIIARSGTGAVLLPRPIGNAWAALTGLVLAD